VMKKIWIIGVGQFGEHAVRSLSKQHRKWHFVLVDLLEVNLIKAQTDRCTLEKADGVEFLNQHLLETVSGPDWIVPALPVHLAGDWCFSKLGADRFFRLDLPEDIGQYLPNPMHGSDGNIYISHANFKCPEDCPEPRDLCTVTREKRKPDMYKVLAEFQYPQFKSLAIRSRQLAPGVGGYRPEQLFTLLDQVQKTKGKVLLSTACRCHGVMSGFHRP
ncbi:MAG: potassium transporter, partial [Deltaproteobacteria bacterium]|nr:potassium transporter [Deltaproteobacteria bacterium]